MLLHPTGRLSVERKYICIASYSMLQYFKLDSVVGGAKLI